MFKNIRYWLQKKLLSIPTPTAPKPGPILDHSVELVQEFERCRLKAYQDGGGVWTCGWGSTKDVTEGTVWTQDHADAVFLEDIAWVEDCIDENVTVPLIQPEYDALCSLIFNIGCPAFKKSTLLKHVNNLDMDLAAQQFAPWNKQTNKRTGRLEVVDGLTARRKAEKELFERSA